MQIFQIKTSHRQQLELAKKFWQLNSKREKMDSSLNVRLGSLCIADSQVDTAHSGRKTFTEGS